jgi:hypothetical protein
MAPSPQGGKLGISRQPLVRLALRRPEYLSPSGRRERHAAAGGRLVRRGAPARIAIAHARAPDMLGMARVMMLMTFAAELAGAERVTVA